MLVDAAHAKYIMDHIQEVQQLVENLQANIDELESLINPILNKDLSSAGITAEIPDPVQQASFYALLAYTQQALIFSYLKSQGVDTSSHDIMKQLERVKLYMNKVNRLKSEPVASKSKVDKRAAYNLIKRGIPRSTIEKFQAETFQGKHTKFSGN